MKKKLLVVSDTPMYRKSNDGPIAVFEPTLREIELIVPLFDEITWLGYFRGRSIPGNARVPETQKVKLRLFPEATGGKSFIAKLKILPYLPLLTYKIWKAVKENDIIHTRGPSVPALLTILLSGIARTKFYWHKYAGNWMQPSPPLFYRIQQSLLKKTSPRNSVCTINGVWPGLNENFLSFENPCLTRKELLVAKDLASAKQYDGRLVICFVGSLFPFKGAGRLLTALSQLTETDFIGEVLVAGDGPQRDELERQASGLRIKISFLGYLNRSAIFEGVYARAHVIVLSSTTEGFPKVIAESAAFGCIPLVSNVSAIGQYIHDRISGLLLENTSPEQICEGLEFIHRNRGDLKKYATRVVQVAESFTYERFIDRVNKDILTKLE